MERDPSPRTMADEVIRAWRCGKNGSFKGMAMAEGRNFQGDDGQSDGNFHHDDGTFTGNVDRTNRDGGGRPLCRIATSGADRLRGTH